MILLLVFFTRRYGEVNEKSVGTICDASVNWHAFNWVQSYRSRDISTITILGKFVKIAIMTSFSVFSEFGDFDKSLPNLNCHI